MNSFPQTLAVLASIAFVAASIAEDAATQPAATKPALPFTIAKETTDITSPLHDDGTPDYVAAFNEKFGKGVTPENNAFVGWLKIVGPQVLPPEQRDKVLNACGLKETDFPQETMLQTRVARDQAASEKWMTEHLWTAEEFPNESAFLKEKEKSLDAAREAFARPKFWIPYVFSDRPFFCEALFDSSKYRELTNHLLARATLRAKSGDFPGFLSDVIAVKRMALHLAINQELQGGYAMVREADRAIGAAAGAGIFDADQCQTLAKELDALPPMPTLTECITCQKWKLLDATCDWATEKRQLLKGFGMAGWSTLDRDSVDWNAMLKQINKTHEELILAVTRNKLEEMYESFSTIEKHCEPNTGHYGSRRMDETPQAYSARVADMLVSPFLGAVSGIETVRREAIMHDQLTRVVVAAAHFHADKKKWPEKLDDLAPAYLKELPKDLFSEGGEDPIEYLPMTNGIVVKSLGIIVGGKKENYLRNTIEVGAN